MCDTHNFNWIGQKTINIDFYDFLLEECNDGVLSGETAWSYYKIICRFASHTQCFESQIDKKNKSAFPVLLRKYDKVDIEYLFSIAPALNQHSIEFRIIQILSVSLNVKVKDVLALEIKSYDAVISGYACNVVAKYISSQRWSDRAEKNSSDSKKFVFYSQRGSQYSIDSFRSRLSDFNSYLGKLGFIEICSRDIRKTTLTEIELKKLIEVLDW